MSRTLCMFILPYALSVGGQLLYFEHKGDPLCEIHTHRINEGALDVQGLFNEIQMNLIKRHYYILSSDFRLHCNNRILTRQSPNLNALKQILSKYRQKVDIMYPDHVIEGVSFVYCDRDKLLPPFKAGTRFELEFNFRIRPVLSKGAMGKYPLLFLESDSAKMTVWMDLGKRLELVYFQKDAEDRKGNYWKSILEMELSTSLRVNRTRCGTFGAADACCGHFYIEIGGGVTGNMVKVHLNEDAVMRTSSNELFQTGELVKIWLFKATHIVDSVVTDVAMRFA